MLSQLELKAIILKIKLNAYFKNKLEKFIIARKQIYYNDDLNYSNILIKLKWKNNFNGPKTILLMYTSRIDNNKDIFYETYLYFNKHKPLHLTLEEFNIIKDYGDIIRHFDIESFLNDIFNENLLSS